MYERPIFTFNMYYTCVCFTTGTMHCRTCCVSFGNAIAVWGGSFPGDSLTYIYIYIFSCICIIRGRRFFYKSNHYLCMSNSPPPLYLMKPMDADNLEIFQGFDEVNTNAKSLIIPQTNALMNSPNKQPRARPAPTPSCPSTSATSPSHSAYPLFVKNTLPPYKRHGRSDGKRHPATQHPRHRQIPPIKELLQTHRQP